MQDMQKALKGQMDQVTSLKFNDFKDLKNVDFGRMSLKVDLNAATKNLSLNGMQSQFNNFIGIKGEKSEIKYNEYKDLHRSADGFLEAITQKIDLYDSIYSCENVYILPTTSIEDEYVVVVLKIGDEELRGFFGGEYLIQQWSKKQKIFQAVHKCKPHNFFLNQQRFVYSLEGFDEEAEYLYISNFFQSIYQKVRNPFFSTDNLNGKHDVSVYIDTKQIVIVNGESAKWAQLKIETIIHMHQNQELNDDSQHLNEYSDAFLSDANFKDILKNCEFISQGDTPQGFSENLRVHYVSSEGYMRKEIHLVIEEELTIRIISVNPNRGMFEVIEVFSFEKSFIEIGAFDKISSISLQNYGDNDNLIVIHMSNGQVKVFSESIQMQMIDFANNVKAAQEEEEDSESDEEEKARIQTLIEQRNRPWNKFKSYFIEPEPIPEYSRHKVKDSSQNSNKNQALTAIRNFFTNQIKKNYFYVQTFFVRRQFLYYSGYYTNDTEKILVKRVLISEIKSNDLSSSNKSAIPAIVTLQYTLQVALLKDVILHVNIFNDFFLANTTLIISHQKILSIYDFLTQSWSHMIPSEQGSDELNHVQTYFGMQRDEIDSLLLNYVYGNSIFDCIIKYRGKFIRRLKYYNDNQKQYFEKSHMFEHQKVLQMQRNMDARNYRQYGDQTIRTLFLIQDPKLGIQQIWMSENGSRITKFIDQIPLREQFQLVDIPNARSDSVIIYSATQRKLFVYEIPNSKQCLNPNQLIKYLKYEISNFDYDSNQKVQYFIFFDKIYFQRDGNLRVIQFNSKSGVIQDINFNGQIKEMYMTHPESVYFKDKNNIFRYANLHIQRNFDIDKQPSEVINCRGAFCTRIEYSISMNRIALFTSSFELSIFPLLDRCRIDLMASQEFDKNYICSKFIENKLIALKKPNVLVTWNTDTGKIEGYQTIDNLNFENCKKHTDWNGCTLLKEIKDIKVKTKKKRDDDDSVNLSEEDLNNGSGQLDSLDDDQIEKSFDFDASDADEKAEEERELMNNQNLHKYKLIEIISPTEVVQHNEFLYDFQPGTYLYASNPYLLVMDETCTLFFLIESGKKFKTLRLLNTFYEPQMKVGKPLYFSPNFYHRIFIDPRSKEIVINFTLTNTNIYSMNKSMRKQIMFQIEKTHPMIYFHDNDKIIYLTVHGVEKLILIEKVLGTRRRKASCKLVEISNLYYNEKSFVRRFILDPLSFNNQQASQMNKLDILKFRSDILKRNLYFNVYLDNNSEQTKKGLPRFFQDKNISGFDYFMINNYRQENMFSYLTWKMIEQLGRKKVQIRDLEPHFITELCYTVTPDFKNITSLMSDNFDVLDSLISYVNNEDLEKDHQNLVAFTDLMFIPDLDGKTPLHYSLQKNNTRVTDRLVRALASTDFDHHSRFILDIYAELIEIVPQSMSFYLNERMKTPEWIKHYSRGHIHPENDCDFVMTADQIWKENLDKSLQGKLYNQSDDLEVPLEMFILDLPHMHKYLNDHADNFLEALADTDEIDIFSNNAVKALIEIKWPLVKNAIKKFLFYPYLTFLMSFLLYTVVIFENYHKEKANDLVIDEMQTVISDDETLEKMKSIKIPKFDDFQNVDFWLQNQMTIIKFIIMSFVSYFFLIEMRQLLIAGFVKYLGSPWNYLDLIPLFLITFSMYFSRYGFEPKYERPLNAIACFFMWIKFLYFWRIFRQTSKFISMLTAIIVDMKEFMVVFFITLVSFGQAMYIMSNNNMTEEQLQESGVTEDEMPNRVRFITSMTDSIFFAYRMSLGDFDTSQLGEIHKTLVIIMFILATLFLTIMMLNILIAVISDSYARVESTSVEEMYKNFADLIAENEYLVKQDQLEKHDIMGDYLYIAKVDKTEGSDEIQSKLNEISKKVETKTKTIEKVLRDTQRTMINAMNHQSETFIQQYKDAQIKSEMKFKQMANRNSFAPPQLTGNIRMNSMMAHEQQDLGRSPLKDGKTESQINKILNT